MLLVFFFVGILTLFTLITILLVGSVFEIEVQNFQKASKHIHLEPKESCIILRLYFLDRILWFRKKIQNKTIQQQAKKWENKIDVAKIEEHMKNSKNDWKDIKEILQHLKIRLSGLDLRLSIGTEDAVLTSYIVTLFASTIGIVLPHIADRKPHNYQYGIQPIYGFRNEYKLTLDCIINVKMVHIIRIIITQVKKRSGEKYERTSNTRFNDNCHEQYTRHGRCEYHYRGTH